MAEPTETAGRRPGWKTFGLLAVVLAILLSLGTWQVMRLSWKEGLIADMNARLGSAPVALAEIEQRLASGQPIDYQPMRATGQFDHGRERHFLATLDGQPGFHVYTPLVLADGRILFVNRGFVPDDLKDPSRRKPGQVEGLVTVTGLARAELLEKPSFIVPDNDPKANLFFWKDIKVMAASTGLDQTKVLPFFLDADATPNPGNYPKGGVTQIDLPNNHLSYAVTWYGLALVLLVVSVLAFRRRAR